MKIVQEPIVEYQVQIKITEARYVSDYKIQLKFNNENKKIVDFESFLTSSQHPSIQKYLDKTKFKKFDIINGNLNWNDYDMIFPLSDLRNGQIS